MIIWALKFVPTASYPKRALDDVHPLLFPAASAARYALKCTYLTLLHAQFVELCLAFEAYSLARPYRKFTRAGEPRGRGCRVAVGASAIAA
jgi:hypothetical protein